MSWLTKVAMKKRWLTLLIVVIITGASIWSLFTLQMELIPDIEIPATTVITIYPQADPEMIMEAVTVKVESAFEGLPGLDQIISTASDGSTITIAMFEFGTDMAEVNRRLKDNLDSLELPDEVRNLPQLSPELEENPFLLAINIDMLPVVMLSLHGDMSPGELKQLATTEIMPVLSNVDGVYSVLIEGGSDQQVIIDLDPEKMSEAGVSLSAVAYALSQQSFDSLEQIKNVPLTTTGTPLANLGEVKIGLPANAAISRTNGETSIAISIMKAQGANTVEVSDGIMAALEEIEADLPEGVTLYTILNQAEYIKDSINDLTQNAIIGCVLAIVIVFLFLMSFRPSLVTAISIPLSIIIGFFIMRFFGITINLLTLSAMAIAVGRVIDNSIVVVEIIYRRIQHGEPYESATIGGVSEIVGAITSSTIATIIIFVPLAFVGGIVGELFIPFALTMTAALVASLLVALIVIPPLSNFKVKSQPKDKTHWYQRIYLKSLNWSLAHKVLTIVIAVVLFLGSFALIPVIGTSFLPPMGAKILTVDVAVPGSTDITATLDVTTRVEQIVLQHPMVQEIQTTIGGSDSIMGSFASMLSGGGNNASMIVILSNEADMELTASELRNVLESEVPDAFVTVTSGEAMISSVMGSGVDISILGDRYEDISSVAQQLYVELEDIEEVTNLELELISAELKPDITLDPAKMIAAGLGQEQIVAIQQEFYLMQTGRTVTQAVIDGQTYGVYINSIMPKIKDISVISSLKVGFPVPVNLGDIANVSLKEQPTMMLRVDGKLSARISGTITAEDIGAVNRTIQDKINKLTLPEGVEAVQGGTAEMMEETFSNMYIAIIVAIVLAFAVLAITYRSLLTPVIIMISLPLASIGALLALLVTGHTLGVLALMGVLMLVGIVLTNAIVLLDMVERLRRSGMSIDSAILEAGRNRLRPILMTALTTMIGMLPLAIGQGEGTIFSAELAIVVIGGLFSSTLLTLLVIPAIYSLLKREKKQKA